MPEEKSPERKPERKRSKKGPPAPHPNRTPLPDNLDATLAKLVSEAEGPVWQKRASA